MNRRSFLQSVGRGRFLSALFFRDATNRQMAEAISDEKPKLDVSKRPDPLFATPQELHQYTLEQQWKRLSRNKSVKLMPKLEPFNPMYAMDGRFKAYPHLLYYFQLGLLQGAAINPGQTVTVTGRQRLSRGRLDA